MEEKNMSKYIALQKENRRYVFTYREDINKYNVGKEQMMTIGSTITFEKLRPEKALEQLQELKKRGYLEFRNPQEVSWYATRENNTPYQEKWSVKDGYLIPIESHSAGVVTIDGTECKLIDEWANGTVSFELGRDTNSDMEWYMVRAKETMEDYEGTYTQEYDKRPNREEVESKHEDMLAAVAIDRHEAEVHERIYGNADRLEIEREVEAEMQAEKLYEDIMRNMGKATIREMESVEDDLGYAAYCESFHGYDREATASDFEHFRDYGHTWGPGCEEPKPSKEERLENYTKSNMEKNKALLPMMEKAILNGVPESRIREVLTYNMVGDFDKSHEEMNQELARWCERANLPEERWKPVENGQIVLWDEKNTWIYLYEESKVRHIDTNANINEVYWGSLNGTEIILKDNSTGLYKYSKEFNEQYVTGQAELTDIENYRWREVAAKEISHNVMEIINEHKTAEIEAEQKARAEDAEKNPKLEKYSMQEISQAVELNKKIIAAIIGPKEKKITNTSENIEVKEYMGTWYVISTEEIDGKKLFLLEHEEYGDEIASIIVDQEANIVLEDVWNGFDDYREQIYEPLVEQCKLAMETAGYSFDEMESYDGYLKFNQKIYSQTFETWQETKEWLDGVVFDDPEKTAAVEQIMHPERFQKNQHKGR